MKRHFDKELNELREKLSSMASLVESMIDIAIKALIERNSEILGSIFNNETEVNKKHIEVDELSLKLIALYQPAGIDLRFITSAMKINSELERIGDQAVNISQNTANLIKQPFFINLSIIPQMTEIAKAMVKDCIKAFINKDVELAKNILLRDNELDELKKEVFRKLIDSIIENPDRTEYFIDLLLISRNLEKIGDHATNICEDVIFMVLGQDIRHHHLPHLFDDH
ncbi:MAG: phosphate signaling complex protein PhoU [Elusimicrobia bacterium]|nr:phosphate signaling complex protein PhoU [Elusimicrobiota bacterium]MBU2614121.1 phosphate signaling complex protein PhoU [Elusimicrobiota bacterium]